MLRNDLLSTRDLKKRQFDLRLKSQLTSGMVAFLKNRF